VSARKEKEKKTKDGRGGELLEEEGDSEWRASAPFVVGG